MASARTRSTKPKSRSKTTRSKTKPVKAKPIRLSFWRRLPKPHVPKMIRDTDRLADMLIGASITLFVVALTTGFHQAEIPTASANGKNPRAVSHITRPDPSTPNTTAPPANSVDTYTVAPNMPRVIDIPSIGVRARVLSVGLDSTGAIKTPNNVFDTAWYNGSSLPGDPGASLIDGHVSGWTTHGVFYSLKNVQTGASIQIERGDGQKLNYVVIKTMSYDANNVDMATVLSSAIPGRSGLNLITCSGSVVSGTSDFSQRLVVFAVLQ